MRRLSILLLFPCLALGQYDQMARNAFLNEHVQQTFEFWSISRPSTRFHAAFRPYLSSSWQSATDSALPFRSYPFRNFFLSNTYNERPEARNWFNVQLHPLVESETGFDLLTEKPLQSTAGGLHMKVNINDDFTFAGTVVGGNARLPFFLDTVVSSRRILPDFGQAYRGRQAGYHFFDYQGYVSYSPRNNKVFNFQLGRDKHFIGNGHRSLLLSDHAPAYPFLRINTNVWRLQYNVWYAWMNDVQNAAGLKRRFTNKYGAFHYLSLNITKTFNVGIFENVVWRGTDSNQVRNFDVNYLNPLIFFRPVEYSLGSSDNAFLGVNISGVVARRLRLYGQLGLDEFFLKELRARRGWWANKQAWQLGARYINAFGIKGLSVLAEYNQARPYTYSHGLPDQNYGHYGYALAHPLGANFKEVIGDLRLRRSRWELMAQAMAAVTGRDSLEGGSNVGTNIFLSYTTRNAEYGHKTAQGIHTRILQSHLRFTYFLLPALNFRLEAGYIQRSERMGSLYSLENPYLYLSLSSGIWNSRRDF